MKLTMEDLTGNGINVYGYYTGSANINGQADISISRCQGSNIWGYYGSNSETRKGYGKRRSRSQVVQQEIAYMEL